MDRSFLLVLCLVTLPNVQLGQSQCDVVRIAAAVYEVVGPALETMQKDMKNMKSDMKNNMKSDIASLSQKVDNLTAEVEKVYSGFSSVNESMRDDLNCVKTELSRVNGIISDLGGHLQTHSQQTTSAVAQLDTRLGSLNESMRDDFRGVERGLSSTANIICDKIEEHDYQITTKLTRMNQSLTGEIINNRNGLKCGGISGCGGVGWRHAVYLDMTDPNTNCPSGWQLTGYSKRTCGRISTGSGTCDSAFFPVSGGPYSQVCGRIRAYQYGLPDAFYTPERHINSAYVCGVAVMHGNPRQHIWTFAAGPWENTSITALCPCDGGSVGAPSFVGEDYFCEAGYVNPGYRNYTAEDSFHSNDTLWDGEDCHSTSTCCSFHNPPYFTKTLNQTTSDDLELRMCLIDSITHDNIAVELVEFYVK